MKKSVSLFVLSCLHLCVQAQAPQGINYQSILRNGSNQILSSTNVGVSMNLHQLTSSGIVVYSEHFSTTTTSLGMINLVIGQGIPDLGTFSTIDWGQGPYFAEISIDQTGGTNYSSLGTQQLMSVPYALFAETSNNPGPQGAPGLNGQDGVSVINSFVQNDSLYVTLSNGQTLNTGYVRGPQGIQGLMGNTGSTGSQGIQGPIGGTGLQGSQGIQGLQGVAGTNGVGIVSTVDNGNGTITFNYSDGTSFTTGNLIQNSNYQIGDTIYGGRIFYIDETGEHGLVFKPSITQGAVNYDAPAGTPSTLASYIGGGYLNALLRDQFFLQSGSSDIINPNASQATTLSSDGRRYGEYYIPCLAELRELYLQKTALGITSIDNFISSNIQYGSPSNNGRYYFSFVDGTFFRNTVDGFSATAVYVRKF